MEGAKDTLKVHIKHLCYSIVLSIALVLGIAGVYHLINMQAKDVGTTAVNYLYDFTDLQELADNMSALKSLCTEEVYSVLTIDNEERALNTYLKFQGLETRVEVLVCRYSKSTGYVIYTLHTDALLAGRRFLFMYDLNSAGKICSVYEAELLDFR